MTAARLPLVELAVFSSGICRSEVVTLKGRISVDPAICSGKPCIRGTRIMVTNILGMMAGGKSVDDVLDAYPELSRDDVEAALEYATRVIDEEKVIQRG